MFDASCHGNERVTSEIAYFYAEWLLTSVDPIAQHILKRNHTLIVPIVNVDGFPTHRKLMNFKPPRTNGVDPNRNFNFIWDQCGSATTGGGCSLDPNSYVYQGPSPESEVENRHYRRLWAKYQPYHYLNMHTGAPEQMWYAQNACPADRAYFLSVHEKYRILAESKGLPVYPASPCGGIGCFDCTPYHYHRIFGWSCELHPAVGANPSYEELPAIFENWLPFFITLSLESKVRPLTIDLPVIGAVALAVTDAALIIYYLTTVAV